MKKTFTAQAALLLCDKHKNEEMDLYCKRCKKPICSECVRTDHNGHEFETITKCSRKLINNRDGFLKDLRATVARQKKRKEMILRETNCRNETLLKMKLSSLEKKREEMHQSVNILIDQQKAECKSYSDKLSIEVYKLVKKFGEQEDEIEKMLNIFEKTTTKGLDIIEYYEKLCSRVNDIEVPRFHEANDRQVYQEGEINNDRLKEMIGTVKEISSVPLVIGKPFSFNHKDVTAPVYDIRPISNHQAWISFYDKDLMLMTNKGICIESVKKGNLGGYNFIVTKEGSFVVPKIQSHLVFKIDRSGKVSFIIETLPLSPFQVGKALDENILVTLVDTFSGTRIAQSQRKAQMVTPGGQVLHTYEFGEDRSTRS